MAGAPYPAIMHVNKTLAKFFPSIFLLFPAHSWSLFQFFGKQNVYEPNFANFFGDFQLDIVFNVPNDFQKICFSFFVG